MYFALADDLHAIRLCMERLLPARKDRPLDLDLPPIQTVEQVSLAMGTVSRALSDGQITPGEAETIAKVLAVQKDVIATAELERRVEKLEEQIRIDRLEKRVAADEEGGLTLENLYHYAMLEDLEGFRRQTMDPRCPDRMMMENALNTPIPKRVKRWFRKSLLENRLREWKKTSSAGTDAHRE